MIWYVPWTSGCEKGETQEWCQHRRGGEDMGGGGGLGGLGGKQRGGEGGGVGRVKGGGVSEVNTMGAVISDGGHLIPRSQREAAGSDYCLLPVCCSTLPLTLREYSAHTVLKHELTKRWIKTSRKQLTPPVIDSKSSAEHLRWAALGSFRSHTHCQLDLACGKDRGKTSTRLCSRWMSV